MVKLIKLSHRILNCVIDNDRNRIFTWCDKFPACLGIWNRSGSYGCVFQSKKRYPKKKILPPVFDISRSHPTYNTYSGFTEQIRKLSKNRSIYKIDLEKTKSTGPMSIYFYGDETELVDNLQAFFILEQ